MRSPVRSAREPVWGLACELDDEAVLPLDERRAARTGCETTSAGKGTGVTEAFLTARLVWSWALRALPDTGFCERGSEAEFSELGLVEDDTGGEGRTLRAI